MHVINMSGRKKTVKRRVNRTGSRIQIVSTVRKVSDHRIFCWCLWPVVGSGLVIWNQREKLIHIQRSKILYLRRSQIPTGSLDPKNVRFISGQRIDFHNFRRRISATSVCDSLIRSQTIGTVNQTFSRRKFFSNGIVPMTINMFQF